MNYSMQTLTEITTDLLAGKINRHEAVHRTMRRREAGLCDSCPTMLEVGRDLEDDEAYLCEGCKTCECGMASRECECGEPEYTDRDRCPLREDA